MGMKNSNESFQTPAGAEAPLNEILRNDRCRTTPDALRVATTDGRTIVLSREGRFGGRSKRPEGEALERMQRRIEAELYSVSDPMDRIHRCWDLADEFEYQNEPWGAVLIYACLVEVEPKDLRNQLFLSDALIGVGELEQALELVEALHAHDPEAVEVTEQIVHLLAALGRDWREYPWSTPPTVAELDEETARRCCAWLRDHGAADFPSFHCDVFGREILLFDEHGLAELLERQPGVERIDNGSHVFWAATDGLTDE